MNVISAPAFTAVQQLLLVIANPDLSGCGNLILLIAYEIASLIIFPLTLHWGLRLTAKTLRYSLIGVASNRDSE